MKRDLAGRYDEYWRSRDTGPTRARSRVRARLATRLLEASERAEARPGAAREPLRLLEVGCGPGGALEVFAAAGFAARGVDVSPLAVEAARARGLSAEVGELGEDPLPGGQDVVVALEVLEHLADPLAALAELRGALRPGGRIVVSLPNEFHILRRLALLAGRSGLGGHDDPHLRHFDDRSARRLFREAGLRVSAVAADSLVPPRGGWRWLRPVGRWLAGLSPGLFALSRVYLLEVPR